MARVFIPFVVEKVVSSNLQPVVGATVTVTSRPTGGAVNVYPTETGVTPLGSITTDANGSVNGWIGEGSYNLAVSGGTPSITPYTEAFEAVYGAGVGNVATSAIGSAQIQTSAVGTTQLADGGVTSNKLATGAVTTSTIAAGAITAATIASGAVVGALSPSSIPFADLVQGSILGVKPSMGANPWSVQFGQTNPGITAPGTYNTFFSIPTAWSGVHAAFFAVITNVNFVNGVTMNSVGTQSLAQGYWAYTVAQTGNLFITWLSIGY